MVLSSDGVFGGRPRGRFCGGGGGGDGAGGSGNLANRSDSGGSLSSPSISPGAFVGCGNSALGAGLLTSRLSSSIISSTMVTTRTYASRATIVAYVVGMN